MKWRAIALVALETLARTPAAGAHVDVDFDRAEVLRAGEDVLALAQTGDGFLWVGTAAGVYRYDGRELRAVSEVPRRRVLALAASGNRLWVALEKPHVVGSLVDGAWSEDELMTQDIFALAAAGDRVWIGTRRLARLDHRQRRPVWEGLPPEGDGDLRVLRLASDGSLLVGTTQGVGRWTGRWQMLWRGGSVRALEETAPGHVAAVATRPDRFELIQRLALSGAKVELNPTFTESPARALVRDGQGGAWVGTRRGVVRMRPIGDGVVRAVDERAQLPQHEVSAMLIDLEGNLWLATNVGLVRVPRARPFHVVATDPGEVASLATLGDGSVLMVLDPDTVVRASAGRIETVGRGLARNGMMGIVPDPGGDWIGSWQDGLFRADRRGLQRVPLAGWETGDTIRPLLRSAHGRGLVLAVGAARLATGTPAAPTWTSFADLGIRSELVAGVEDAEGRLWLASEKEGLVVVDRGGRRQRLGSAQGLPSERLTALAPARAGLWIGTRDRGLVHLRDGRFTAVGRAQGLGTDAVAGLVRDSRHLWITTASEGIVRVGEAELEALVEGRSPRVAGVAFTTRDGLPTSGSAGRSPPAGGIDPSGRVWLATFRGAVVFDQPDAPPPALPAPRVESVRLDGHELAPGARIAVGGGTLDVRYTAVLFEGRERLRFRHRLEGLDTGWRDAGDAHETHYPALPPGSYRFRLRPYFNGALETTPAPEAVFAFTLVPPFHRTPTFRALAAACLLLGALVAARLRLRARRQHQALLAQERNRIAREIHDSLEQTLYAAKMQLEVGGGPAERRTPHLSRGIELVERAIEEARAAVWALRTGIFGRADLSVAISVTAGDSLRQSDVAFSLETEGLPYKLPAVTEWHIGQTVREAFTNALKHGHPRKITVRLGYGPSLVVSVIDDGTGLASPVEGDSSGHYGLQGMRERLRACGGTVTLDSAPERGTIVRIEVPRDARPS